MSKRYRCGKLTIHWSDGDSSCSLSSSFAEKLEDIPHIICWCPALTGICNGLCKYTLRYTSVLPLPLMSLLRAKFHPDIPTFVDSVLDCSVNPDFIRTTQVFGEDVLHHTFAISRPWTYVIHRERPKLLNLWMSPAN